VTLFAAKQGLGARQFTPSYCILRKWEGDSEVTGSCETTSNQFSNQLSRTPLNAVTPNRTHRYEKAGCNAVTSTFYPTHNPKVAGSNPALATKEKSQVKNHFSLLCPVSLLVEKPQNLRDDLGVNSTTEEQCRGGVPEVVKSKPLESGFLQQTSEVTVDQVTGINRVTPSVREYELLLAPRSPRLGKSFCCSYRRCISESRATDGKRICRRDFLVLRGSTSSRRRSSS